MYDTPKSESGYAAGATMVSVEDWDLSAMLDASRRQLLHSPVSPDEIASQLGREAAAAGDDAHIVLSEESAAEMPGFVRLCATIPLSARVFDLLFNGRSGFRAQYYLSPTAGERLSQALIGRLGPTLALAHERYYRSRYAAFFTASVSGPWTKLWPANDSSNFQAAREGELAPSLWRKYSEYPGSMGFRAPLPAYPAVEIKGTWVQPDGSADWLSPDKVDRALRLHRHGFV